MAGATFGVEITPTNDGSILDLLDAVAWLRARLAESGALLLRGHGWTFAALETFVHAMVPRPIVYGGSRARVSVDDTIQKVEQGMMAISLHCELAFTPFRPDVCVFACVQPAAEGGETLLGDGAHVLEALTPATRARFTGPAAITYQRLFPAAAWKRTFRTDSRAAVEAALSRFERVRVAFSRDDNLMCHFTTAAVVDGLDGRPAFANNVSNMVEAEGIVGSTVTHADGQALTLELRAELRDRLRESAVPHRWQAGDVLLVDNWRVLHGRNAFWDAKRDIYAHFGNLREATLRPEQVLAGGRS